MYLKRLFFIVFVYSTTAVGLCAQDVTSNEKAQEYILKVMSEYKNPLAYFPFRRDLFLPSEAEMMEIELQNSYPDNSLVMGPFIFMKEGAELDREPFLDAKGRPMFTNLFGAKKPSSLSGGSEYFRAKQKRLLNAHPNLGKFLLFNEGFLKLK